MQISNQSALEDPDRTSGKSIICPMREAFYYRTVSVQHHLNMTRIQINSNFEVILSPHNGTAPIKSVK